MFCIRYVHISDYFLLINLTHGLFPDFSVFVLFKASSAGSLTFWIINTWHNASQKWENKSTELSCVSWGQSIHNLGIWEVRQGGRWEVNIGSQPGSTRALVVSPSTQRFFSFTFDYFLRFFFFKNLLHCRWFSRPWYRYTSLKWNSWL